MIYIVTALKAEAQAFIDYYKDLKKSKLSQFTIFKNKDILIIISNIGTSNARVATQTLINHFDINDNDIFLNIGICAASKQYKIGELLEIGSIVHEGTTLKLNNKKNQIVCSDTAQTTDKYEIADMESFGFYDAIIHNPAIKNFHIIKIVSDHFEPQKVTKDKSKSLIFNLIDDINSIIFS